MKLIRNGVLLGVVAGIAVAVPVVLNIFVKDRIIEQSNQLINDNLVQILGKGSYDNSLTNSCYLPEQNFSKIEKFYPLTLKDKLVGYGLISSAKGYQSDIKSLLVVDPQGTIVGVRILEQAETPGFGDKIQLVKTWVNAFIGKTPAQAKTPAWNFKPQGYFDNFTGATITPRAVINELKLDMVEIVSQVVQNPEIYKQWQKCSIK